MRKIPVVVVIVALVTTLTFAVQCGRDFSRYPSGGTSDVALTSVDPNTGSNDAEIPISLRGSGFIGTPRLLVGATECTSVTVVTNKLITAVIPAGIAAGLYNIQLITETLDEAVLTDAFTVIDPANISIKSILPNQGLNDVAVPVVITGANFVTGAQVMIGTTVLTSSTVSTTTTIDAVVQPDLTPGTYDVVVTNPSGNYATLVAGYSVLDGTKLQVTGIDPNHGANDVDTQVTITGANFDEEPTVLIGYTLATEVVRLASDILSAIVPAGITPGTYNVRVINSDDSYAELEDGYTVDDAGDDDTIDDDTTDDDTTDDDTTDDDTSDDDVTDDDVTDDDVTDDDVTDDDVTDDDVTE